MRKKILIIPPTTKISVRKRLREIGLSLSRYYEIYMLQWHEPRQENFITKTNAAVRDFFKKSKIYEKGGINFVECPIFHRPLSMARYYNPISIGNLLAAHKIDVVMNGIHYFFFTPALGNKRLACRHIFDVNDLPAIETESRSGRFSYEFARHEAQKADAVTACSRGLVDYIREHFGRQAMFIPNGTYLDEFHNVDHERVRKIRQKYNFVNKFIIGYIGYVGEWIDIDFLISFYKTLKNKYTDIGLMIVGDGPKIDFYKNTIKDGDIVFTGGIPREEITPYFFAVDAAVLPSKKSLFQDLAFHIKLIEYTAAKKMAISSPLEEVKRLEFPNISIAELSLEKWVEAIDNVRKTQWRYEWDKLAESYDWKNISDKFRDIIEGLD